MTTIKEANAARPRTAAEKLRLAITMGQAKWSRHPAGGGFSFVAHMDVIEKIMAELADEDIQLPEPLIVGDDADQVIIFDGVPFRVRNAARNGAHLVPDPEIPRATQQDKHEASRMRIVAHKVWVRHIRTVH